MLIGIGTFDLLVGLWSIFSPNWKDAYRAGGRGSWVHGLSELMLDAEDAPPKWWVALQDGSIMLFELADLFLFWFMVGFVTVDQLFAWTSQIWELSSCNPKPNEFYIYSKTPNGIITASNTDWTANSSWINCSSNVGLTQIGPTITIPANSTANLTQVVQWTGLSSASKRACNTRVVDLSDGSVIFQHNFNFDRHDAGYSNGMFVHKFFTQDKARTLQFQFQQTQRYPDLLTFADTGHLSIEWAVWDPHE